MLKNFKNDNGIGILEKFDEIIGKGKLNQLRRLVSAPDIDMIETGEHLRYHPRVEGSIPLW